MNQTIVFTSGFNIRGIPNRNILPKNKLYCIAIVHGFIDSGRADRDTYA